MKFSRRSFLGSSAALLGSRILEPFTTSLPHSRVDPLVQAVSLAHHPAESSPVIFVDVARVAGLNVQNVWGGVNHKRYIIESKGSGVAFFDFDQDGWIDIYLTNGDRLDHEEPYPDGKT